MLNLIVIFLLNLHSQDERLYDINKSFELYGSVFREVNENYVIELDPELLMMAGITGMLKDLDPYTEFYQEENKDEINVITEGSYVGFGLSIREINNQLVISDFSSDFRAYNAGLRLGDIIYQIDTVVTVNMNSEQIRKYTQGLVGSVTNMKVIRKKDTLDFSVQRQKVNVDNIKYYSIIDNNIAYIKLDRFSKDSFKDFYDAFNVLKASNPNGLIFDLRDNPGGLLEEAVKICELFVRKGETIVSTKSRNPRKNNTYKSTMNPIDSIIPIAVLINENSASASEIVAGCFQDLDRAVILGNNSFGKGLVQSVFRLPYNSNLKITTARYFTPSGRLIQKKEYYEKKFGEPDSSIFYTKNGRSVIEKQGIAPDSLIIEENYDNFIGDLYFKNIIFDFANGYTDYQVAESKVRDGSYLEDFYNFLKEINYQYKSKAELNIEELIEIAGKEGKDQIIKDLDKINVDFKLSIDDLINRNMNDLTKLLEYEILKRHLNETKLTEIFIKSDSLVNISKDILLNREDRKILSKSIIIENKKH